MKYEILEDKVVIMGYDQDGLSVEIPEMIEGHAVTELAPYAFSGTDIEEIILPKTVTKIGRYAFYNCKKLRRISFYNTMKDLGAGAFTNVHNVREIEISFVETKKSCLREFLIELPEEQDITFHFEDGDAQILFPEFFEEAIENTPARNLETMTHGSGMFYRNCFVQKELDIKLYDDCFGKGKALEFPKTVYRMALNRLMIPYHLEEKAKERYVEYLKENLKECSDWAAARQGKDEMMFLAKNCVETAQDLEVLIESANKQNMIDVLSFLMQEKHKKFGTKRKTFEL